MRYAYTLLIALIAALSANAQTVESGYREMCEVTAPSAAASNCARIYVKDDGGGTTQFCYKDAGGTETCVGAGGTTPDYVLYRKVFGLGTSTGAMSVSPLSSSAHTSTTTVLAGGTLRPGDGAFLFGDAATEILYLDLGPIPSGYTYTNMTVSMMVQNRDTAANNAVFNVSFAAICDGGAAPASYSAFTWSTAQTYTATIDAATQYDWYMDPTAGFDATTNSSGWAAGCVGYMSITRDNTDANTADAGVWSVLVTVPAS